MKIFTQNDIMDLFETVRTYIETITPQILATNMGLKTYQVTTWMNKIPKKLYDQRFLRNLQKYHIAIY